MLKETLKSLEADIQQANILALDCLRDKDGRCIQMRLSFSPVADKLLNFLQWVDCKLAAALGLIRISIYMTYRDGKNTMFVFERKASIKEFYAVLFPSLLQLQGGITNLEYKKQKEVCATGYRKRTELNVRKLSKVDLEREEECGVCLELNDMVVLPDCYHSLCMKCYRNWCKQSQSCPFCRANLEEVSSDSLWVYIGNQDVIDIPSIARENRMRLLSRIEKLPLIEPDPRYAPYNSICDAYIR